MTEQEKVLDKIKKLLSLATSSNEHEAKAAADKANELLVKYNISMQDVSRRGEKIFDEVGLERKSRILKDEMLLLRIIQKHFFVRLLIITDRDSGERKVKIMFLGEKANVQVATYVHEFLLRTLRDCWLAFKKQHKLSERSRPAYTDGFCQGLETQLEVTRKKVETSMAITVMPDRDLTEFFRQKYPHTSSTRMSGWQQDSAANSAGYEAGKQVRIRKGVESGSKSIGGYLGK